MIRVAASTAMALCDDVRGIGHGVGVGKVRPCQADRKRHDDGAERLPYRLDVAACLGGFDFCDGLSRDVFAGEKWLAGIEALQWRPVDHAEVFWSPARQVVDFAGELGHRIGPQPHHKR